MFSEDRLTWDSEVYIPRLSVKSIPNIEFQVVQFKTELHSSHQKHEQLLEQQDDMDRLREESKRLTQEHGEDQQVIHLLEMQKNILAKNQVSLNLTF